MRTRLSLLLLLPVVAACQSVRSPSHDPLWPARSQNDTSARDAYVAPASMEFALPDAAPGSDPVADAARADARAGSPATGDGSAAPAAAAPAPAPSPAVAAALAQNTADKDPWEVTLAGIGSNDRRFRNGTGSAQASLGYYLNDVFEVGVRQNVLFFEGTPDSWNGATRIFADLHIPVSVLRPFVGAEVGWVYGDDIQDETMLGLEAGAKIDVREGTFVFLMAEYQWFFDDADEFDENFDDGSFIYSLGVGFRF
jgi:hypothetical protein